MYEQHLQRQVSHSQLFLVRLRTEAGGDGQFEWYGKVQHVLSGETHYFLEWRELVDILHTLLLTTLEEGDEQTVESKQ